jgi:hypothetical protein
MYQETIRRCRRNRHKVALVWLFKNGVLLICLVRSKWSHRRILLDKVVFFLESDVRRIGMVNWGVVVTHISWISTFQTNV